MKFDEFKTKYLNPPKAKRRPRHIEEAIQITCVEWFRATYKKYLCFAVGNGGSRNKLEAINLKRSGVLAGVSDLIIVANKAVLFVEMKTKTGRQSGYQKMFQDTVKRLGFKYKICRSLYDFQLTINQWLKENI